MNKKYKNILKLNIISFLCFWLIAFLFYLELTTNFDLVVYNAISNVISDNLTSIMTFITNFGSTEAIIIICISLLIIPNTSKSFGIPISITVTCSCILNTILKILFSRERPNILRLVEVSGFSFPSGHAMNNMALYTMLILLLLTLFNDSLKIKILSLSIFILPLTIGFSRIYLGVHYPSDVLAGLFAGFWVGSFIFLVYKK